jgi:excinuclease UvrABC ATPase subunit
MTQNKVCFLPANSSGGEDMVKGELWHEIHSRHRLKETKKSIARAFMKNGKILILDEPTASVDVKTEHEIFRRFKELTRDRMTILISHRFSTVRMVDRILVLEDGKIIEQGTHADLIDWAKSMPRCLSCRPKAIYLFNRTNIDRPCRLDKWPRFRSV